MSLKWIQGRPGVRATQCGGTQTEVFTGNRQKRGDINCFSGKCCRFHVSSFASEPILVTVTRIQGDQLVNIAAGVIEAMDRHAFAGRRGMQRVAAG